MPEPVRLIAAAMLILTGCGDPSANETSNVAVVVVDGTRAVVPSRPHGNVPVPLTEISRVPAPAAALDDDGGLRPLPPAPMRQELPLRAPTDSEWRLAQNDQ